VLWCGDCGLSQLAQVVDPDLLYRDYPFRAGVSSKWREHCEAMADGLDLEIGDFVVDIGANDGTFLDACLTRDAKVLGVDPCPVSDAVPMLPVLWSEETARGLVRMHGHPDVITATNVFGHVDDAADFLRGLAVALPVTGYALIECPHIFPLLEQTAFDTIYHEHLSYWSLRPLERLCEQTGLRVVDVEMFSDLHGGTMRYTLVPDTSPWHVQTSVTGLRILEAAHFAEGLVPYRDFAERAWRNILLFKQALQEERDARWRIAGYGASAKGNVLLQAAGVRRDLLSVIVDDTPAKWGLYTPGTEIPIQPPDALREADILVLLSWNNAEALKASALKQGFRGRFFVPHPDPHFEDAA